MSPPAQSIGTPLPVATSISSGSLRAEMEVRRASGGAFTAREALGIVVPLCTALANLHAQGKKYFIHPSSLHYRKGRETSVAEDRAHIPPTLPRDRACLAPEERK